MTRYPTPGQAKTRLAGVLGEAQAAQIASELALHCIRRMHAVSLSGVAELDVRYTGGGASQMRRWVGRRIPMRAQGGGDLGARLNEAMREALEAGAPAAIAVGSDAPALGRAQILDALWALESSPVVLGPATDGGYYLVGVRADAARVAPPALFAADIPWGADTVFSETVGSLARVGLAAATLEPLSDIDRPEDVAVWQQMRAEEERVRVAPEISVVIPTLNESGRVAGAIESARAAGIRGIVVADGGSSDNTTALAHAAGAVVVSSPRGRSRQLNAGAARATGDVLVFLHADCRLPSDAAEQIRAVMGDPRVALGAFRFEAGDGARLADRMITALGRLRHRVFALPYGDQALFVRRSDFEDLGGFPEIPIMEDYEFALRCRRLGALGATTSSVNSSTRLWRDHGIARATLVYMAVIAGFRLGVAPTELAAWRERRLRRG